MKSFASHDLQIHDLQIRERTANKLEETASFISSELLHYSEVFSLRERRKLKALYYTLNTLSTILLTHSDRG